MNRLIGAIALSILGFINPFDLNSQYDISAIPDTILRDATSVVLENFETLEVYSKTNIIYRKEKIILVLDNTTDQLGDLNTYFNKFSKIEDAQMVISTTEGKVIKKFKKNDMAFQAVFDGMTIANDYKILFWRPYKGRTPYVVKISWTESAKESFALKSYNPITSENMSILKSEYKVINYDEGNTVRFTASDLGTPTYDAVSKAYILKNSNLTRIKCKKISENFERSIVRPILENFNMDGFEGSIATWQDFGLWMEYINKNRDLLDPKSTLEIKKQIGDLKDKKEVVSNLYQYLQKNMRYVSIQLGIGGFQTMTAQEVHNNKYGDCKALSNYMKAMLKVADINSYYILVQAGESHIYNHNPDFPFNNFNHLILGVPLQQDTIFLECTAQNNATGYLGSFTGNRKAFWIDGNNSKLVKTKIYNHTNNNIFVKTKINFSNHVNPACTTDITLQGMGIEHLRLNQTQSHPDDVFRKYIQENVIKGAKDLKVETRNYDAYNFSMSYENSDYILKQNNNNIINLSSISIPESIFKGFSDIKKKLVFDTGYTIEDMYEIELPPNCTIEKIDTVQTFTSDAIQTDFHTEIKDKTITVHKKMVVIAGDFNRKTRVEREELAHQFHNFIFQKCIIACELKP